MSPVTCDPQVTSNPHMGDVHQGRHEANGKNEWEQWTVTGVGIGEGIMWLAGAA